MKLKKLLMINKWFFLAILLFGQALIGCSIRSQVDLNSIESEILSFNRLPTDVQRVIQKKKKRILTNLDSSLYSATYKNTAIIGVYKGHKVFKIKRNYFFLEWNHNEVSSPYVVKDYKLYLCLSGNGHWLHSGNKRRVKCKVFDLTKYLK